MPHTATDPKTTAGILSADSRLTASEAFELAERYTRYGLDLPGTDSRCADTAIRSHAQAALVQLGAVNHPDLRPPV